MGLIQTAIGQALGAVGGAALVAKKLNEEDERQAAKEKAAKEKKSKLAAKTIKTAQDKKIDSPKQLYFADGSAEPLGSSNEVATVLATHSLQNATESKKRSRDKVRERKQMLMKRKLVSK